MSDKNKIELSREEMMEILQNNKKMAQQIADLNRNLEEVKANSGNVGPKKLKEVKDRKVRIRFVDGKPIVGFANKGSENKPLYIYNAPDPQNPKENILFVDLIIKGKDKPVTIPYMQFREESEIIECLIKDIKEEPWQINQGQTRKTIVGEDWSINESEYVVDMDVKGVYRTYIVELPDGEDLEISENYVNA